MNRSKVLLLAVALLAIGNTVLFDSAYAQGPNDHANANHCLRRDGSRSTGPRGLVTTWWNYSNICKRDIIVFYCFNKSCGRQGSYFKRSILIRAFSTTSIKVQLGEMKGFSRTTTMEVMACYSSRTRRPPRNLDKHETCSIYPAHRNKDGG